MFRTQEYRDLLKAQHVLVGILDDPKASRVEKTQASGQLVRIVDTKRVLRGQPAPKPADVRTKRQVGTTTAPHLAPTPTPTPPVAQQ